MTLNHSVGFRLPASLTYVNFFVLFPGIELSLIRFLLSIDCFCAIAWCIDPFLYCHCRNYAREFERSWCFSYKCCTINIIISCIEIYANIKRCSRFLFEYVSVWCGWHSMRTIHYILCARNKG